MKDSESTVNDLLSRVERALEAYLFMSRLTPFSMYGKGEHLRTQRELGVALRAAVKATKSCVDPIEKKVHEKLKLAYLEHQTHTGQVASLVRDARAIMPHDDSADRARMS